MLYFSKVKLFIIYFTIIILSLFSLFNFIKIDQKILFSKKINLGLDLQGGSYLLLEVDSRPTINQKLQNKLVSFKKHLKSNDIKYKKVKLKNETIIFSIDEKDIETFDKIFKENSNLNPYFNQYRSYELEYFIENNHAQFNMDEQLKMVNDKAHELVDYFKSEIQVFPTLGLLSV